MISTLILCWESINLQEAISEANKSERLLDMFILIKLEIVMICSNLFDTINIFKIISSLIHLLDRYSKEKKVTKLFYLLIFTSKS